MTVGKSGESPTLRCLVYSSEGVALDVFKVNVMSSSKYINGLL
jgi:hypothetical protein